MINLGDYNNKNSTIQQKKNMFKFNFGKDSKEEASNSENQEYILENFKLL